MTDDVSERIREIRERVEAATEGPWKKADEFDVTVGWRIRGPGEPHTGDCDCNRGITTALVTGRNSPDPENARFIAAARQDVPYLLSLVEEVGDALQKVRVVPKYTDHEDPYEAAEFLAALRDAAQEGEG